MYIHVCVCVYVNVFACVCDVKYGVSAIMKAAYCGHLDIVTYLRGAGADYNLTDIVCVTYC